MIMKWIHTGYSWVTCMGLQWHHKWGIHLIYGVYHSRVARRLEEYKHIMAATKTDKQLRPYIWKE
jgi:hypothetical protein